MFHLFSADCCLWCCLCQKNQEQIGKMLILLREIGVKVGFELTFGKVQDDVLGNIFNDVSEQNTDTW